MSTAHTFLVVCFTVAYLVVMFLDVMLILMCLTEEGVNAVRRWYAAGSMALLLVSGFGMYLAWSKQIGTPLSILCCVIVGTYLLYTKALQDGV